MSTFELTVEATIAIVLLADPFIRAIFIRVVTENEPERRLKYVGETPSAGPEEVPRTGGTEAGYVADILERVQAGAVIPWGGRAYDR
ncbi:hypothetical protein [Streptomyces canus]|uniref:hypothetical protein n=1 Tax=Streptomyces canus TaxID=58343 RepID=UPI00224EC9C5|nr:hypothetical protein [Streptomyces canus]MCX4862175.1 hypothetical protein [Streptomyces canus]